MGIYKASARKKNHEFVEFRNFEIQNARTPVCEKIMLSKVK